jgi:hypothetical protein
MMEKLLPTALPQAKSIENELRQKQAAEDATVQAVAQSVYMRRRLLEVEAAQALVEEVRTAAAAAAWLNPSLMLQSPPPPFSSAEIAAIRLPASGPSRWSVAWHL